jgi:riboflavin kinase/FMN adenylyltransferase
MSGKALQVLEGLDGLRRLPAGAVVSIGNFDGVHVGHEQILATARRLRSDAGGSAVALVTFEPHPATVLKPGAVPPRLTPPALKRRLLEERGVDLLVNLPPAPEVLDLSAERFWEILRDAVRPSHLVEGSTFVFGKGRGGTIDRLREWTSTSGVRLHVIDPVSVPLLDMRVAPVSSTLVRWLLSNGRARDAAICLGRAYPIEGRVIQGHQRGRTIGVPTANLDCGEQHLPDDGVYAARCSVGGKAYPVALSIGTMPTFGADLRRQVEAHLVGFDGDLYGQTLSVDVLDWLRGQKKYAEVESLKAQLKRDIESALGLQSLDVARPIARVG